MLEEERARSQLLWHQHLCLKVCWGFTAIWECQHLGCSRGFLLSPPVNHPKTCFLLPTGTRLELLLPVLPCVTHFGVLASSGGVCRICLTSCHPGNNKPPWKPAQFPPGTGLKELIVPLGSTAIPTGSALGFAGVRAEQGNGNKLTGVLAHRVSQIKEQDFTDQIKDFTH